MESRVQPFGGLTRPDRVIRVSRRAVLTAALGAGVVGAGGLAGVAADGRYWRRMAPAQLAFLGRVLVAS